MAESIKQLLERHRELLPNVLTEGKALAAIESKLLKGAPIKTTSTKWNERYNWVARQTGCTVYDLRNRRSLWLLDDLVDPLWELIAQGTLPTGTAARLATEAQRRVGKTDRDGFVLELRRSLHRQGYIQPSDEDEEPQASLPQPPEAHEWDDQREFWSRMQTSLGAFAAEKLKSFPEHERDLLVSELSRDLSSAFQTHMQRWNRLLRTQQEAKRISRYQLRSALLILHMDPPKRGSKLDTLLTKAKSQKKQLARMYHPDSNAGREHLRGQYQAVIEAYLVVEQYVNENMSIPEQARPKLRVVPGGKGQ